MMVLLISFLIGIATGFFDSVVGAGGLISVPSLIFLGLPPQAAIATDRFGTIGQSITAFIKFQKERKIVWKYSLLFSFLALFGALIGVDILLKINQEILQKTVGLLVIAVLPFIFFKNDLGVKKAETGWAKILLGILLYFGVTIYGGFLGQGTGPIAFYVLAYFFGLSMTEIIATRIFPWLVISLTSLFMLATKSMIDYKIGLVLFVGMAIGGYFGAHVAIKKGDLWIKRVFILFVVISGIKLFFF